MATDKRAQLWSIQYLRGIAALMVVLHHARNPRPWLYNPLENFNVGARGVDIFFVISGFIMYTVARTETVQKFVTRRVARVMPLYWLATAAFIAITLASGTVYSRLTLLRSFLLIPTFNPATPSQIWPVLVPGWTLMYEMFFYAIFAIGLLTGRLLPFVVTAILFLCGLGLAVKFSGPILQTYTSLRLLQFLGGFLLGVLFRSFNFRHAAPLLAIGIGAAIVAGIYTNNVIAWTVIALCIVAGALGCEARGLVEHHRPLKLLGDASYSIYLTHILVIIAVDTVLKTVPLTGMMQFIAVVATAVLASTFLGILVFRFVETPLLRLLIRRPTI